MAHRKAVNGFTHGYSGYQNYGCRCDECRAGLAANTRKARERRAARLAADPSLAPHGNVSTYFNWRCRCDACKSAHAARARRLRRQLLTGWTGAVIP